MLKQAIIDADALREVALKNAEAIVVEKYSNQIKEAVNMMLEQEEDPLAMEEDPLAGPPGMGGPPLEDGEEGLPSSRATDGLPTEEPAGDLGSTIDLAAIDGERLCPCPDKGAAVEVNFAQLQDLMSTLEQDPEEEVEIGEEEVMPGPTPEEALAENLDVDEEVMIELDDLLDEQMPLHAEEDEAQETEGENEAYAEAVEPALDDDDDAIAVLDQQADENPAWYAESIKRNKKMLHENSKLTKTNSKMLKEHKHLLKEQKQILKENKEMKNLLRKLSGKLEEVNLSNAKLIYTNQVLSNGTSLNERQKQRIVEAINSADSVEAAKSIYETLQSAVGSSLQSRDKSQSLSEAIVRGNATTLRQKQKQTTQDPHMERMKKLAGI